MFPSLRTRLLITIAAITGSMLWVSAANAALAPDGSGGISLMTSNGAVGAMIKILIAGLPAILMGLAISAFSNPLAGLFATAIGMCSLAVAGGTMGEWILRTDATLPGDYKSLALELFIWFAAVIGFLIVAKAVRPFIRNLVPALADKHHHGNNMQLMKFDVVSLAAGGFTLIIGGVLCFVLLRTAESGQIVGGLILGFMIAAFASNLIAGSIFGEKQPVSKDSDQLERVVSTPRNPIPVLMSPAIVALIGYIITLMSHADGDELRSDWYTGGVIGMAKALPIYYASAGVMGCCLGIGWAQVVADGSPLTADEDEEDASKDPAQGLINLAADAKTD